MPAGYQYRICPADQPLTEACFQRTPLAFDRTKQALQWNNGTRWPIAGTWVDTGTLPAGSTWAMNPVPPQQFARGPATLGSKPASTTFAPPRRRPFPPWHRSRASTSTTPARASPKASPTARTCATARSSAQRAASSPRRARRTPAGARRTLSTPRTSSACAQAIGWEAASSTLS